MDTHSKVVYLLVRYVKFMAHGSACDFDAPEIRLHEREAQMRDRIQENILQQRDMAVCFH